MDQSRFQLIVRKLKRGDKASFKVLFDACHHGLFNYLYFRSKDAVLSEDLLQETFLKIWENRKKLDENQSVKAYLYKIANNLFLNHQRHLRIVDEHRNQIQSNSFLDTNHPQFLMEEQEFRIKLMSEIESLPDRTREIFLMSRVEALFNREIAERLEISLKTVEVHIGKALNQLSSSIPEEYLKKK